mgnify:CR=1 FL=1
MIVALSLTGVLKFTDDKIMKVDYWIIALLLIGFGMMSLVISLKPLIISYKNHKKVLKPVHQQIIDLYKNNELSKMFISYNYVYNECTINDDKSLMIIFMPNSSVYLFLDINDDSYTISFEFTNEFFDNLTEEKKSDFDTIIDKYENISLVTYDLTINTKLETIFDNIRVFVDNNLDQIKNSF